MTSKRVAVKQIDISQTNYALIKELQMFRFVLEHTFNTAQEKSQ